MFVRVSKISIKRDMLIKSRNDDPELPHFVNVAKEKVNA